MNTPIDIIIPTCLTVEAVTPLAEEVRDSAGVDVRIYATCEDACASKNRNIGLEWAASEFRIMMDDDITGLPQGWVSELIQPLKDHPECVMVSPQLITPDRKYAVMMGCPDPRPIGTGLRIVVGPHLLTACIAIRKDSLRFDERFIGSGWEDNDYCDRQNKRYPGCTRIIQSDIQVVHRNEMKNQQEHFGRNRRHYFATRGAR